MGKKDHRHEIQAIIEITQKLEKNDIAYFSKGQIPFITSQSFSDYGRTVLHMAVWYNKAEILTLLLAKPDILAMINTLDLIYIPLFQIIEKPNIADSYLVWRQENQAGFREFLSELNGCKKGVLLYYKVSDNEQQEQNKDYFDKFILRKGEQAEFLKIHKQKIEGLNLNQIEADLPFCYFIRNQETPLHLAFFDQKLICAISLIEKGAKFDLKNCIEQRPIDVLIGKKEKQITFLQHLTQAKLQDNDDQIKMRNMIKRKISILNKLTQSEIDDCSEILPTRSENMLNSAAIGLSRRIVQMQQSVQGDMECSMIEEIPVEAHPRPILEFEIRHVLKSLGFQTTKGLSSFFNSQI